MNIKRSLWLIVIATLQPIIPVFAHPGHGHKDVDGNNIIHYMTEPVHLISFAVIVALFFVVCFYFLKHQKRSKTKE